MSLRKNILYCRLSREDDRAPGTTEEKLQAQEETCRRLAEQYGLTVHEVIVERASGGTLAGRPELLRLLHLCRRGEVGAILCTFPDRLSRLDGRDRADFEEALTDGSVTVIATTGVTKYDHEEEPFGRRVLAEAAAYELRAFGRRLKERNAQKLRENKRTGGSTGYGYKRDKTAPGGYVIVPHEYPYLCRILRDILAGKSEYGIATQLNDEGIPPPRHRHTGEGSAWHQTTVMRIALNPFYAGRHAQRTKQVKRGNRKYIVHLKPEDYIIAPTEGEWEHPLTWEEYCTLRAAFIDRYRPNPRVGLLTGLLYCQEGGRMARQGKERYQCFCHKEGKPHRNIMRRFVENAAKGAVRYAIAMLPPDELGNLQPRQDRAQLFDAHTKAQRAVRETFEQLDELARRASFFSGLMGQEAYEESLRRAGTAHNAAKQQEAHLAGLLSEPVMEEIQPVLCVVRDMGFETMWERLTEDERRSLLRGFLDRIDLAPKPPKTEKGWSRHRPPIVTYAGWVRRLGIVPET